MKKQQLVNKRLILLRFLEHLSHFNLKLPQLKPLQLKKKQRWLNRQKQLLKKQQLVIKRLMKLIKKWQNVKQRQILRRLLEHLSQPNLKLPQSKPLQFKKQQRLLNRQKQLLKKQQLAIKRLMKLIKKWQNVKLRQMLRRFLEHLSHLKLPRPKPLQFNKQRRLNKQKQLLKK